MPLRSSIGLPEAIDQSDLADDGLGYRGTARQTRSELSGSDPGGGHDGFAIPLCGVPAAAVRIRRIPWALKSLFGLIQPETLVQAFQTLGI
jgi:hypothetical protein